MLPVSLSIEGLNSYAEKVEIDFQRFHKNKLFGIFGDTGTGKSTILDAIILAIYGETPRLGGRHRREAINPLRDTVKIEFSFRMGEHEYLIERWIGSESRSKSESRCRLFELQGGIKHPKAEKSGEFEKAIKDIIGLTVDEFCKVVILPQNQFADILKLTPANRAELLGNLFDVNVFGEPLYEVVRNLANKTQEDRSRIDARLEDLKDVSEEVIGKKEQEKQEAETRLKELSIQEKQLRYEYQRIVTFIELQAERRGLESALAKMQERAAEIERMKEKVKGDDELSEYKGLYAERKKLKGSIGKLIEEQQELGRILNKIAQELQEVSKQRDDFEASFLEKQEELIRKISDAQSAVEIRDKLVVVRREAQEMLDKILRNKEELEKNDKEIQRISQEVEGITSRKVSIEGSLKEIGLSKAEKKHYELLVEYRPKLSEVRSLEAEIQRLMLKRGREEKDRNLLFGKIADYVFSNLGYKVEISSEIDTAFDCKKKELEAELARKRQELKEIEVKDLAITLSSRLIQGQPCPVCGSREHPEPASGEVAGVMKEAEREIAECEQKMITIEDLKARTNPMRNRLTEIEAGLRRTDEDLTEKTGRLEALKAELSKVFSDEFVSDSERILTVLETRRKESERLMAHLNQSNDQLNDKKGFLHAKQQKKAEITATLEQMKAQHERLTSDISRLVEEMNLKTRGKDPEVLMKEAQVERKRLENTRETLERAVRNKEKERQEKAQELQKEEVMLEEDHRRFGEIQSALAGKAKEKAVSIEEMEGLFLDDRVKQKMNIEIREYEDEWNRNLGALSQVTKRIEQIDIVELPPDEPSKTETLLKKAQDDIADLNKKLGVLHESVERDKGLLKEKSALIEQQKRLDKAIGNIKTLEGLVRGKDMVEFLATFFMKDIVRHANLLIEALAGKRFHLNYSMDGELSVSDLFYNSKRSVATLSGGETFLVSFALALALSFYIQQRRGRAIHFFFVDEGFSSLDEDLLDSLSAIISELRSQDRLVGLISHLNELKQVIQEYVYVYRDTTGTSKIRYGALEHV
jgi:exonuclease SbcC